MTIENNVPNMDCMDREELWEFWQRFTRPKRADARLLFPDKPKGYIGACQDLACYASNKATAIACRQSGNIQAALTYENIADLVYDRLPNWAKW
jgi:hypothetical protein